MGYFVEDVKIYFKKIVLIAIKKTTKVSKRPLLFFSLVVPTVPKLGLGQ